MNKKGKCILHLVSFYEPDPKWVIFLQIPLQNPLFEIRIKHNIYFITIFYWLYLNMCKMHIVQWFNAHCCTFALTIDT